MSESGMRQNLVKALKSLDAVPIENHMRAGTPDVNFIGGWIECKWMKFWPKGADVRSVRFSHPLTKEQGLWARRRTLAGGVSLVVAQVSREWFFFDGLDIRLYFNKMTRPEMRERAIFRMTNGMNKKELLEWISSL